MTWVKSTSAASFLYCKSTDASLIVSHFSVFLPLTVTRAAQQHQIHHQIDAGEDNTQPLFPVSPPVAVACTQTKFRQYEVKRVSALQLNLNYGTACAVVFVCAVCTVR